MGFRSILATEHTGFKISDEFRSEYQWLNIPEQDKDGRCYGAITGKREVKFYDKISETKVFKDLQAQLTPDTEHYKPSIVLVLLHECGGLTRVEITNSYIKASEPTEWEEVESVGHDYCYGCSDIKNITPSK